MIKKINSCLRVMIIITGVFAIIFKLTEKTIVRKGNKHGYTSEAYDDIW